MLIEHTGDLEKFLSGISGTDVIAVDTESAGFFKYRATVNLIQVATRTCAALVDPQAVQDFTPLREFARTSETEWIFHGADYDAAVLARELGVGISRIFDTRIASVFLGIQELGLSALTERFLGFPLDKKLQRCDWSRRPLTEGMRKYALLDAICLIPVRDGLKEELQRQNRLEWVMEECAALSEECRKPQERRENPLAFLIKGSATLSPRALAVLKEVWTLRDRISRKIDRAPFMVLGNPALLEIAQKAPRTIAGLNTIRGLPHDFLARYGKELQEAIRNGCAGDPIQVPRQPRRSEYAIRLSGYEVELVKLLREARDNIAMQTGLPASTIASPHVLAEMAHSRPESTVELVERGFLRKWQAELFGKTILPLLTREPPPNSYPRKRRRRRHHRTEPVI